MVLFQIRKDIHQTDNRQGILEKKVFLLDISRLRDKKQLQV